MRRIFATYLFMEIPMKQRPTGLVLATSLVMTGLFAFALSGCGGGTGSDPALDSAGVATAVQLRAVPAPAPPAPPPNSAALQALGQAIFNDPNMSTPPGTACASCHQPATGFSGLNGSTLGVAKGSLPSSFGLRNPSQAAYSAQNPPFGFVTTPQGNQIPSGGLFWDGRVNTLAQQALLPLLNPVEMNNQNSNAVVAKVAAANYAKQFTALFGATAFGNPDQAFIQIGQAIQAFESAGPFEAFSSKFDAVIQAKASFTVAERNGLALFQDPRNGCAGCHRLNAASSNPNDSPFTNSNYIVEGIPRNTKIPSNAVASFFDLGLCGPERTTPTAPAGVSISEYCGAFQVPSLRNVALRKFYMHNGFFTNLTDVVTFYSTRNSNPQHWYGPSGIPNDLPAQYQINLEKRKPPFDRSASAGPLLTTAQIGEVVAFLNTLSDGYQPGN